jgi:hypothetical protein
LGVGERSPPHPSKIRSRALVIRIFFLDTI